MTSHETHSESAVDSNYGSKRERLYSSTDGNGRYLNAVHDRVVACRAVEHPFLNWYGKNRLTPVQERILFSECYYWFHNLPFYIAGIAALTRDTGVLREITFNIHDEVCGEKTHAQLYIDFLEGIGVDLNTVRAYKPAKEAATLNRAMERLYSQPPLERALGALFFDEAMSAVMVSKVNDGLKNQGHDSRVRYFWEAHIEVEVGHSNSVFNAIFPYISNEVGREMFEDGAFELEALVEDFWDAISRRLGLENLLLDNRR